MRVRTTAEWRGSALAKARPILPADAGVGPGIEVRTNAIMTECAPEANSEQETRKNLPAFAS
jgi:hypothetical protein